MPPPPIALTSLSIRDFRGIDHLDLDFCGPDGQPNRLVVLAGPNGLGKTAVLEAALISLGGYKLATGPRGKRAVRKGAEDYEIRAELAISTGLIQDTETLTDSADANPPETDPQRPFWYFSSWRAPALVGAVDVTVGKPGKRPAKNDANRLRNVKQQLANTAAAENFPARGRMPRPPYGPLIATINDAWRRFVPDPSREFYVGLAEPDSGGAFDVYYSPPDEPTLTVDDLSSGQLELFLFIAALALNDDREGIIFIDEPELHLDPQWHAPVLRSLMELQPKAQFLIATHSPQIYESAMSYERHFLVPEDDPRAAIWGVATQGA